MIGIVVTRRMSIEKIKCDCLYGDVIGRTKRKLKRSQSALLACNWQHRQSDKVGLGQNGQFLHIHAG